MLKDTILGIDTHYYLQKALTSQLKEPLVSALGGFPFSLKTTIQQDLYEMREAGIKPIFVFSGISLAPIEKPFLTPDDSAKLRTRAWELYDKGQAMDAVEAFGQAGVIHATELFRATMRILRDRNVDFQVAPYAAWPQLVYLEKKGYVDAVFGNPELFLFDIDKVITSLNLNSGNFTWVNKTRLRNDSHLSNDQLTDAILLSGCSFCRTYPPFEAAAPQAGSLFLDAVALVKRFRSIGNAITSHPDQQGYLEIFRKARAAIKHHVIMAEDGKVFQLERNDSPNDVHEFIGQRLPEELYFYLSRGIVGPQVLDMITTEVYIQIAPLDNNESEEYKKFLDVLNGMRTESLSILAKSMHRYWLNREVKVYNWFDVTHPKTLVHKEIGYPLETAQKWNVREDLWGPEMDKQKPWGEFAFCITSLEDKSFAAKTVTPKIPEKLLETEDDIRVNVLWRMLQMRGFIHGETHSPTPWGNALIAAIKSLDTEDETLIMPLYIGLELFRMKALKSENFTPSFSGAPARGSDVDRANTMLISRVCGLVNMDHKAIGYTGPLSRNLLAFNGFSRALTRELRNFIEMTLVNMLMAGDVERDSEYRRDWADLGLKLPFIDEANSCLGIAAKTYLDELCSEPNPTADDVKSKHMNKLPEMIPQAIDVLGDLELGFRVWDGIVAGIRILQKEGVMEAECKTFLEADRWLSDRRPGIGKFGNRSS